MTGSMAQDGGDGEGWAAFARVWLRIGALGFGGPAGQIALMHRELVERRGWLNDAAYLRALNFCMLLPGPEAQQLSVWCGWRLRGVAGGLLAGLAFVIPGALIMALLTGLYISFGRLPLVAAMFAGVQAVVLAIVAQALARVAARALHGRLAWVLAAGAFVLLSFLDVPFPAVVLGAGVIGWLAARHQPAPPPEALPPVRWGATLATVLLWAGIWAAPLVVAALLLGGDHPLVALGRFFVGQAAVSFGGAYAALSYVAQHAVEARGWLTAPEMLDGLALAETTPGPLVLVFQFIGGLAASRFDGPWAPAGGAALGMSLVLWMTFAPSFLWIFAAAPHLDRLSRRPALAGALAAITAAVVGVMASLATWFALHVLFGTLDAVRWGPLRLWSPGGGFDWPAAAIAVTAWLLLARLRVPLGWVLALGAAAGVGVAAMNGG